MQPYICESVYGYAWEVVDDFWPRYSDMTISLLRVVFITIIIVVVVVLIVVVGTVVRHMILL